MFADYLVQFVQAYKEAGMDIYAISPVNEPNYEANRYCTVAEQLADFIANYMGPTFEKQEVNPQIIFGELAELLVHTGTRNIQCSFSQEVCRKRNGS